MPQEVPPDRHIELAAHRVMEVAKRAREKAARTGVAAQCTGASAERTYAAWIRTGLVSLAAGVGTKKTLGGVPPGRAVMLTSSVLAAFAAFCFVAAVWHELFPGTPPLRPDLPRLPRVLLVALAVLFGAWFGRTSGT